MRKEIYAALEVADNEIRLLVSEYFNGRLHILKIENVAHHGISNHQIVNSESIVTALKNALENIEKNVKIKVTRVILLIPSLKLKRVNRTLHSDINDPLGRIMKDNIRDIYKSAYNQKPLADYELVNASVYRYRVNGFYIHKVPLNEKAGRLFAEVDLYYIDRKIVYQLASIVEQSGIEILDVCIDGLGVGKEANLLDINSDKYQVALLCEDQQLTMSLFYKGRLVHSDTLPVQIDSWFKKVADKLSIPLELASKLVRNNINLSTDLFESVPVSLWSHQNEKFTCSQQDIMNIIKDDITDYFNEIKLACSDIIATGKSEFILVGKNAMFEGFDAGLKRVLNAPVTKYIPSTLGARDSSYVSLLGAFYNHIDQRLWQTNIKESFDQLEIIEEKKQVELHLTDKLRSILKG